MSISDRSEEILLYAAGELAEDERTELARWLAEQGAEGAAELARARETIASLALALDPVVPPPETRERLMARAGTRSRARTGPPPARERWRPLLISALAASVVVALGAGLIHRMFFGSILDENLTLTQANLALEEENLELGAEVEKLDAELDLLRESTRSAELRVAMLRRPDLIVADLSGSSAQPDASARIFWDKEDYRCYLHAKGVEPVDGAVLVLWLFARDGRVLSLGRIEPDYSGEATLFVELPRDMRGIVRAAITAETEEPGSAPSGPVQLSWEESVS